MGEESPSALSPPPASPPIPPYLRPLLQTGHIRHIFHPTVRLCLSGRTFNLKGPLSSHTNPLPDSRDLCVCVLLPCACTFTCRCILAYILCILNCKSEYLCQMEGGLLRVRWKITAGSAVMSLLDTLSNRQKIGLNISPAPRLLLLPECRPGSSDCFWQWQQEQAAREDFLKTSSCIRRKKIRRMRQIKQDIVFFYFNLLANFLELWLLKLGYHHRSYFAPWMPVVDFSVCWIENRHEYTSLSCTMKGRSTSRLHSAWCSVLQLWHQDF